MLHHISDKIRKLTGSRRGEIPGFYRVRVFNKSRNTIWLAKNTMGDLLDIIRPGRSLDIRLPVSNFVELFAYKASSEMSISGLNYYDKRKFNSESVWIIE